MKFNIPILAMLCSLLATGCITEVNFEPEKTPASYAVYGRITNDPRPQELRIFKTGLFSAEETQQAIGGATVTIKDDLGNEENYIEPAFGLYLLQQNTVKGLPGRTYELEIVMPGGEIIRSRPETMPPLLKIEKLEAGNDSTQFFTARVDVNIPAGGNTWLRWEADRIYTRTEINQNVVFMNPFAPPPRVCFLTESYARQDPNIFHTDLPDSYQLVRQEAGTVKVDERFYERNCIQVYQFNTTAASYEFWRDVKKVANPQGTIFDTPPAQVPGNLYLEGNENQPVLGYFEAAAVDTARIFTTRNDIKPIYVIDPCTRDYPVNGSTFFGFREECLNCLVIPNTTLEVPWFW